MNIGTDKTGGQLAFRSAVSTEAARIDASQRLLIGHTASVPVSGQDQDFQISAGIVTAGGITLARYHTVDSLAAASVLTFAKSATTTIGSDGSVALPASATLTVADLTSAIVLTGVHTETPEDSPVSPTKATFDPVDESK